MLQIQNRWFLWLLLPLLGIVSSPAIAKEAVTFEAWKESCLATPANRTLQGRMPKKEQLPIQDFGDVRAQATQLLDQFKEGDLSVESNWVGNPPKASEFFDTGRAYYTRSRIPFQPFAQKLKIPAGSKVIFHGDFHGDIRSFISTLVWLNENDYLDGFKLKQPDTYFVFLGDYVDRGSYGVEVLSTLMRLKQDNPNQVFMARGNHEDFQLTATYGFLREGELKYGREFNPLALWRMYDFLPVVIYLGVGNDYVQCNHGGVEPGFDAKPLLADEGKVRYQLLGELKQKTFARENPEWLKDATEESRLVADTKLTDFVPESPTQPATIGFMWNDFAVFHDDPMIGFNPLRMAFNHGEASTKYLLKSAGSESAKLHAVFRAHQHSGIPTPAMNRIVASNGAFRHWQRSDAKANADAERAALKEMLDLAPERNIPDGSVWTFNVSPDSMYGHGNKYTFDTIGILTTAKSFDDWRMKVINVPVSLKEPQPAQTQE